MSNSFIITSANTGFSDNTTTYTGLTGLLNAATTEAIHQCAVRDAGTFSNLYTFVPTNTASVTSTITLRKSLADTSITVSYSSDETGIKEDTSNSVTFANTDEGGFSVAIPTEVGTNTLTIGFLGLQFSTDTATDCVTFLTSAGNQVEGAANQTLYRVPNGSIGSSIEVNAKYRVRFSFTSSDFYFYINTNNRTTDTVQGTRKNGANGNQSVTFAAAETGAKEDTSNTDSLVSGDDFNYYVTFNAGTETITVRQAKTTCINTANIFPLISGAAVNNGLGVNFNTTTYAKIAGSLLQVSTTESNSQIYSRFDFTLKELVSLVSANTITTSASTVTAMDNGADSSITVSYAAAETGLKNDSTNTAAITSATDEIDYKIATPNTSGLIRFIIIGTLGETASSTPSTLSTVLQPIIF